MHYVIIFTLRIPSRVCQISTFSRNVFVKNDEIFHCCKQYESDLINLFKLSQANKSQLKRLVAEALSLLGTSSTATGRNLTWISLPIFSTIVLPLTLQWRRLSWREYWKKQGRRRACDDDDDDDDDVNLVAKLIIIRLGSQLNIAHQKSILIFKTHNFSNVFISSYGLGDKSLPGNVSIMSPFIEVIYYLLISYIKK